MNVKNSKNKNNNLQKSLPNAVTIFFFFKLCVLKFFFLLCFHILHLRSLLILDMENFWLLWTLEFYLVLKIGEKVFQVSLICNSSLSSINILSIIKLIN